ncbi:MAG: 16S rRNA (uracil(1498)-N(3))-methyltransferase [Clostridiales bacterium]|jgi:16S rRNA (uracil1498-N3)-methyltransferase|nr:16S rRNA (uracil(1498)-N(3))-methyltransferase [Clostridiales bacterium]
MPKYFIAPEDIDKENSRLVIRGENADHMINALRARRGDHVTACDGLCTDYTCEISEIFTGGNKKLILKILAESGVSEPKLRVTLYQSIPKSDKMEYVIQKCVEMGIYEITPIYTEFSAVRSLSDAKLSRYRKISEAAAKQSMRGFIPCINPPITLSEALTESSGRGLVFVPYENERQTGLKDLLSQYDMAQVISAAFFIGSEGGFSGREAEMFINAKIPRVTLGGRILRTETAGVAVLTILMYASNELGVAGGGYDG